MKGPGVMPEQNTEEDEDTDRAITRGPCKYSMSPSFHI